MHTPTPHVSDARKAPFPRKIEFEYTGTITVIVVDGLNWGRVEQVDMGRWRIMQGDRARTRHPVPTSELRATVERIAFADRKATMKTAPR